MLHLVAAHTPHPSCRYPASMEIMNVLKLGLIGYGVVGIAYVALGSGFFENRETGWWDGLPKPKKIIFGTALGASILQTFL